MLEGSLFLCLLYQVQRATSFPKLVSVDKCLSDFFLFVDEFLILQTKIYNVNVA